MTKVALIHYWLVTWRGGEKVVESILKLFPNADVYTMFYNEKECGKYLEGHRVFTSAYNTSVARKHYQKLFPLYPEILRSIKLQEDYDLIISSESGPAKGIVRSGHNATIPHLCYIHTPMRYCWVSMETYLRAIPFVLRPFARTGFERLKRWDKTTIGNVDHYVANSDNVKNRVERYYGRDAAVVHPPIASEHFENQQLVRPAEEREGYLYLGALAPYKGVELLIDAFNRSGRKLLIIGEGSEQRRLEAKAQSNIQFLGRLPWNEMRRHIRGVRALLLPAEEDFGMTPLEAMAYGLPIIALGKGGALETVVEAPGLPGVSSGLFFPEPTCESLERAIQRFEENIGEYDPAWIRGHARQFDEGNFQRKFLSEISKLMTGGILDSAAKSSINSDADM